MTIQPAQKTWYVSEGKLVLCVSTTVNGRKLEARAVQDRYPAPPDYTDRHLERMLMNELEKVVFPEGLR